MKMKKIIAFYCICILIFQISSSDNMNLKEGFVYLSDVDPTILQFIRYKTKENFVGEEIRGYNASKAILTKEAAESLKNVQSILLKIGYSLVIYDAYRPQKAVDNFMEWSKNSDQTNKLKYYPWVDKNRVFELGYVAEKSGHSRGSTVDITIISVNKQLNVNPILHQRYLNDGRNVSLIDDNTEDMFTSFDLFDEASHHDTTLIPQEYLEKRNILRRIMKENGFNEYPYEWWHYTLKNERFPDEYFNFDIE